MTDWDLRKLRVLRTLDELGTVRATAEALRMTPSAVSQQLSSLSTQTGVPLLEAHGRRVRLTDAARVLLRHTDIVLAQLERAEAELEGFARGEAGHVRVGAFATAIPRLVVPAVSALRRAHPGLTVKVHQADAAEVYDLLSAGEIDVGLSLAAQAPTGQDSRFDRAELLTDPLDVALPAHHRLANAPGPRLADLAEGAVDLRRRGPLAGHHRRRVRPGGIRTRTSTRGGRLAGHPRHGRRRAGRRTDPTAGRGRPDPRRRTPGTTRRPAAPPRGLRGPFRRARTALDRPRHARPG